MKAVRIVGVGKALPGPARTNAEVLQYLGEDITEEWIEAKVGIKTRHVSIHVRPEEEGGGGGGIDHEDMKPAPGCRNSELCTKAVKKALKMAGLKKEELDMIIVATCTPDYPIPSTASLVQEALGLDECAVVDIRSACCGSVQAMVTAVQYLQTGFYKTIAVVGSETGSVYGNLDRTRKNFTRGDAVNAVMIGDGAGAAVLRGFDEEEGEEPHGIEILYMKLNCIGKGKAPGMYLPAGGSVRPFNKRVEEEGGHYFKHDYRAVLQHGAELYWRGLQDCLKDTKLTMADIDLFVPHQANGKVTETAVKMGVPEARLFHNFERVGNTANASLMLALEETVTENTLPEGALVVMVAAESTKWLYGTLLLKWSPLKGKGEFTRKKTQAGCCGRWMASTVAFGIDTAFWCKRTLGW